MSVGDLNGDGVGDLAVGGAYFSSPRTFLIFVSIGVENVCIPTSVANSDYSDAGSITGTYEQTVTVTCDTNFVGGGTATCGVDGTFNTLTCECDSSSFAYNGVKVVITLTTTPQHP